MLDLGVHFAEAKVPSLNNNLSHWQLPEERQRSRKEKVQLREEIDQEQSEPKDILPAETAANEYKAKMGAALQTDDQVCTFDSRER